MLRMVGTVVKLVLALGVIYMVWNVGPVYLAYREFSTEVAGATRAGGRGAERALVAEVAGLAERIGVPLARGAIRARKEGSRTYLEVTYTEELRLAPTITYPWTFSVNAEGLPVKPQTMGDVIDTLNDSK